MSDLDGLTTFQAIEKQRKIPQERMDALREFYLTTRAMAEAKPHEAILNTERLAREIFQTLFWQKTGKDARGMSMKEVFLAVREMVPAYVEVELETIGFAYQHALHSPMVGLTADSDYLVGGMESMTILFEWFEGMVTAMEAPEEKDEDLDGVSALALSHSTPLHKSMVKNLGVLNEMVRVNPKDVFALLNRGVILNNQRKANAALRDFDAAIAEDASIGALFFHRGNAYQLLGDFEKALENYQFALDLKMESAALYHARGMTFAKMGDVGQAYVNFDLAMAIEKGYGESKRQKKILKKANRFALFRSN